METKAKRLERLRDERRSICDALEKIVETAEADNDGEGRSLTEEETTKLQELRDKIPQIDERIKWNQELNEALLDAPAPRIVPPEGRSAPEPDKGDTPHPYADPPKPKEFAVPKNHGRLRHIKTPEAAYQFGRWAAACMGHDGSREFCRDHGIELRIHQEKVNTTGGYLVPEQLIPDMIRLIEQYGVFPAYSRRIAMTSDTATRPRRTTGLTAYFVGESGDGTESTMALDQVQLVAKKQMVLFTVTNELGEDAYIDMGDELMGEAVYAITKQIDDCGFLGDGTSTYGGIVGLSRSFLNQTGTIGNIAGLVVSADDEWGAFLLAEYNEVVGLLPTYADTPNAAWYCHKTVYANSMQRLMYAAGGNSKDDLAGGTGATFLGYPVRFIQSMPKTDAVSQIACYLGDLAMASMYGDRRQMAMAFSDSAYVGSRSVFERDESAVRVTNRFDINVHDVGNQSATAASRVPGPMIGLISAAS